jgi:hypothetical protein
MEREVAGRPHWPSGDIGCYVIPHYPLQRTAFAEKVLDFVLALDEYWRSTGDEIRLQAV